MAWLSHKLDTFLAAVVIAVAAIAASQSQVFMTQYVHRLAAQLEDAKTQLAGIETGLRYKLMSDTVRGEIETDARKRADALQESYDAVAGINPFARPLVLARSGDRSLLETTWRDFIPALPVTPGAIAYLVVGMILGFAAYEIVKLPVVLLLREPRRRKFRRRG